MFSRPRTVILCLVFIFLNVLVWLVLGVVTATNLHLALPEIPLLRGIMAGMSFTGAGILLVAFILLLKRRRIGFFLALGFLLVTALLTFFDQVGWVDLVTLVIHLIPILLLIKDRDWYLPKRPSSLKE